MKQQTQPWFLHVTTLPEPAGGFRLSLIPHRKNRVGVVITVAIIRTGQLHPPHSRSGASAGTSPAAGEEHVGASLEAEARTHMTSPWTRTTKKPAVQYYHPEILWQLVFLCFFPSVSKSLAGLRTTNGTSEGPSQLFQQILWKLLLPPDKSAQTAVRRTQKQPGNRSVCRLADGLTAAAISPNISKVRTNFRPKRRIEKNKAIIKISLTCRKMIRVFI